MQWLRQHLSPDSQLRLLYGLVSGELAPSRLPTAAAAKDGCEALWRCLSAYDRTHLRHPAAPPTLRWALQQELLLPSSKLPSSARPLHRLMANQALQVMALRRQDTSIQAVLSAAVTAPALSGGGGDWSPSLRQVLKLNQELMTQILAQHRTTPTSDVFPASASPASLAVQQQSRRRREQRRQERAEAEERRRQRQHSRRSLLLEAPTAEEKPPPPLPSAEETEPTPSAAVAAPLMSSVEETEPTPSAPPAAVAPPAPSAAVAPPAPSAAVAPPEKARCLCLCQPSMRMLSHAGCRVFGGKVRCANTATTLLLGKDDRPVRIGHSTDKEVEEASQHSLVPNWRKLAAAAPPEGGAGYVFVCKDCQSFIEWYKEGVMGKARSALKVAAAAAVVAETVGAVGESVAPEQYKDAFRAIRPSTYLGSAATAARSQLNDYGQGEGLPQLRESVQGRIHHATTKLRRLEERIGDTGRVTKDTVKGERVEELRTLAADVVKTFQHAEAAHRSYQNKYESCRRLQRVSHSLDCGTDDDKMNRDMTELRQRKDRALKDMAGQIGAYQVQVVQLNGTLTAARTSLKETEELAEELKRDAERDHQELEQMYDDLERRKGSERADKKRIETLREEQEALQKKLATEVQLSASQQEELKHIRSDLDRHRSEAKAAQEASEKTLATTQAELEAKAERLRRDAEQEKKLLNQELEIVKGLRSDDQAALEAQRRDAEQEKERLDQELQRTQGLREQDREALQRQRREAQEKQEKLDRQLQTMQRQQERDQDALQRLTATNRDLAQSLTSEREAVAAALRAEAKAVEMVQQLQGKFEAIGRKEAETNTQLEAARAVVERLRRSSEASEAEKAQWEGKTEDLEAQLQLAQHQVEGSMRVAFEGGEMIEVDVTQEYRKGDWDGEAHPRGGRYYEYMYQLKAGVVLRRLQRPPPEQNTWALWEIKGDALWEAAKVANQMKCSWTCWWKYSCLPKTDEAMQHCGWQR